MRIAWLGAKRLFRRRLYVYLLTGRIMADGLSWNARSDDPGTVIAPNEVVVISRIEGVTAFVSRQETISE